MRCKNPYVKAPSGSDAKGFYSSDQVRTAVTPFGCGQCVPCRITKARVWQHRMLLEQALHPDSCFLTLTYDDDHLPRNDDGTGILVKQEVVDFLKRLRYYLDGRKIRYFVVGEYGEDIGKRPHYHMALFNVSYFEKTPISRAWKEGFFYLGDLNKATARYMTGYVMKNLTRDTEEKLYGRPPEFMLSSRGTSRDQLGGLGRPAVKIFANDLLSKDWFKPKIIREIRQGGHKWPLGRYLSRKLADDLGVSSEQWNESLQCYQEEIFVQNIKGGNYLENIKKSMLNQSRSMEKRYKIFKQKRTL